MSDYPANAGWALSYTLINASGKITINAGSSGADFLVSAAAAVTASYAAGTYSWMARVTKATEIFTVGQGTIEILPNLAALTTYDGRSDAKKALDNWMAAWIAVRSGKSYTINGRTFMRDDLSEIITMKETCEADYRKEQAREKFARTGINPNRISVRFARG